MIIWRHCVTFRLKRTMSCLPWRQETYIRSWATSENSDQPARSCSLILIFTGSFWIANGAQFLHADNEDSDQTARMRRLIWIFAERSWSNVHIRRRRPRWLSWMPVRLETRRSRVRTPPRSATFFRGDWSWNIFYGHSLPSADSRRQLSFSGERMCIILVNRLED